MSEDTMDKIKKNSIPKHLIEASTEELKNEVNKSILNKEPEINIDDPKFQEEYSFEFNWKDGRNKIWSGHFVNKILSISELQAVGVLRAKLSGGLDFASLDPLTSEINLMVSHLSYSLIEKPKWAEDLRSLLDVSLLQEIYGEVASHEATFFGYKNPERTS